MCRLLDQCGRRAIEAEVNESEAIVAKARGLK